MQIQQALSAVREGEEAKAQTEPALLVVKAAMVQMEESTKTMMTKTIWAWRWTWPEKRAA